MTARGELLMIVHRVPYPPDKGDKIRSFNQLKFLAERGWRVHLCTLADDPKDLQHAAELRNLCASVFIEPINPRLQKMKSVSAPLTGLPMSARYFYNDNLQQRVNEILSQYPISAALCFCSPMAEYLRRSPHNPLMPKKGRKITCVMDLVDVDSDKWAQYADRTSWPMSWVYGLEGRLLHSYERRVTEEFDAVVLVSAAEAGVFRSRTGMGDKIHSAGNGVDLSYFHPAAEKTGKRNLRISFCGAMGYLPNVDAVTWFAGDILPLIREELGEVEFWIIGGGAGDDVRALAKLPGVNVTGRVEDVRTFVWDSDLSVAPIRIARGIQNKVLEAMAMGVAALVTPQAFEGLEADAGRDLMVAPDNAQEFAKAAIRLLRDPAGRRSLACNGRRAVEEKYSWDGRLQALEDVLAGPVCETSPVQAVA